MSACIVRSSYTAGLALRGTEGSIESSLISTIYAQPLDEAYGYGIQVEGIEGPELLRFDVRNCRIRNAALAGILFHQAGGMIEGTVISGGQYSVAANVGSLPDVSGDNSFSGSVQDDLYWGNFDPSPAPSPGIPTDPL
jgi:hypothetical protein